MAMPNIFATLPTGLSPLAYFDENFAYLEAQIGGASAPVTKTSNFVVAVADEWIINDKAGSALVATLPDAAAFVGRTLFFKTIQAFGVDSASANVVPLVGGAAGTAILGGTAGKWATLVSDGTNWVIMQGN